MIVTAGISAFNKYRQACGNRFYQNSKSSFAREQGYFLPSS